MLIACLPGLSVAQGGEVLTERIYVSKDSIPERKLTLNQAEAEYGPFREPAVNIKHALQRIKDSLIRSGTDTILVLQKRQNEWHNNYRYFKTVQGKQEEFTKQPVRKSEPVYIFWISNNSYFVKKLDQFHVYKTITDPAFRPYALFDFYYKNQAAIKAGKVLNVYADTVRTGVTDQYGKVQQNVSVMPQTFMYRTAALKQLPGCSASIISYESKKDSVSFGIYDYETEPLAPHVEKSSTRYGNDGYYYYFNETLPGNIWIKLVESELLKIESAGLWQLPSAESTPTKGSNKK